MDKEKKEIGKLLELLNEYSKNIGYFNEEDLRGQTKAWILSKEFGWIKWLVENDKIDGIKLRGKMYQVFEFRYQDVATLENELLMLLSISSSPIEDLISYLK